MENEEVLVESFSMIWMVLFLNDFYLFSIPQYSTDRDPEKLLEFVKDCGNSFIPQYLSIIEKRKDEPFTLENKRWQQLRRGRYVEFNLVHDRGTKFGLVTRIFLFMS